MRVIDRKLKANISSMMRLARQNLFTGGENLWYLEQMLFVTLIGFFVPSIGPRKTMIMMHGTAPDRLVPRHQPPPPSDKHEQHNTTN